MGVPFLFTLALWKEWLFVNGLLNCDLLFWDRYWFYPHEAKSDLIRDETQVRPLKFGGVWPNAFLLIGVVLSVALLDPGKPIPGTGWHPWLYLREIVQLFFGGPFAGFGQPQSACGQQLSLRRDYRSGGPFFWHIHHHAAGLANPCHPRPEFGPDRSLALFLGQRRVVVGARQRPDICRIFLLRHKP